MTRDEIKFNAELNSYNHVIKLINQGFDTDDIKSILVETIKSRLEEQKEYQNTFVNSEVKND